MNINTDVFYPKRTITGTFGAKDDIRNQISGLKSEFRADLSNTEVCMDRCKLSMDNDVLSAQESDCVKACFLKVNESKLLISNEMINYVQGVPM